MKYSFTKVLILRPQAKLLFLINNQLPDFDWKLVAKQKPNLTAYVIPDFTNDVGMLISLESNYLKIFQNELMQIIGLKNAKSLKLSFFDFLNCFKFEWHNDVKVIRSKFSKKVCIQSQSISMRLSSKKIKTLEDICGVFDGVNAKWQLLPIKDLTCQSFYKQMIIKFKIISNNTGQQLKHSCNWHWLSHARDPGF